MGRAHHLNRCVWLGKIETWRPAAANNSIDLMFGWDPSEQVATRPLVLQKYGQYNLFYTHDGNKNVSELVFFQQANGIAAHYEYAPFGAVTAASRSTSVTAYDFRDYNPYRFSSEYFDSTLDSVCYIFRYLNMIEGRWTSRDPGEEVFSVNLCRFINNTPLTATDWLGLDDCRDSNSDFNLNWEFKGLGGAIGSFTISYHRKIEQTVCNIRCSDCRAGYTVERTVTDGAGAGMSWELPITGLPSVLKVPLSVSYNMSGGEHYFYNSCTKMETQEGCHSFSLSGSVGAKLGVGRFIEYGISGEVSYSWTDCGHEETKVSLGLILEQCYFGQCWSVDVPLQELNL